MLIINYVNYVNYVFLSRSWIVLTLLKKLNFIFASTKQNIIEHHLISDIRLNVGIVNSYCVSVITASMVATSNSIG